MAQATTFGATVVSSPNAHLNEHRAFLDSPALTPAVSRDASTPDFYDQPVSAQSPFYQHPPASHEVVALQDWHHSKEGKLSVAVLEKDVESGNITPLSLSDPENPFARSHRVQTHTEDTMWPSKLTLKEQKKAEAKCKRREQGVRGCAPIRNRWSKLSKRNRILVQVAIALLVIGVAVAIGVGISAAVKGSYYVSDGTSATVGR